MKPKHRLALILGLCVLGASRPSPADEPTLGLEGVPERLELPLPEGTNRILTANIAADEVASVWLAADEKAALRVALTKVGPGEYEINLADGDVVEWLAGQRSGRSFRVFAETGDGRIVSSIPVAYSRDAAIPPGRLKVWVSTDEGERKPTTYGELWSDPFRVAAIEAERSSGLGEESPIHAACGDKRWQFETVEASDVVTTYRLPLNYEIRETWQAHGELLVETGPRDDLQTAAFLKAPPKKLDFLGSAAAMTVYQRSRRTLPGSRGYLFLYLGDITAGQTSVTLNDRQAKPLIDAVSARQGDHLDFELGDRTYHLCINKLVNVLIGADWAEIEVWQLDSNQHERIGRLLEDLIASEATFIRDGQEYSGAQAVEHLLNKLALTDPPVETLHEFIDRVAGKSSSGKPYRLKLPDGKTIDARDWLRERYSESFFQKHLRDFR